MFVEDQQALKLMEETAVKIDGHYQVALPWRKKPPCMFTKQPTISRIANSPVEETTP